MEVRISLFSHLEKLVEAIGGNAPEVVFKDSTPGKTKFVLSLDFNKLPIPTVSLRPNDQRIFYGDHPHDSSIAEHRAVMSVKNLLEETFSCET